MVTRWAVLLNKLIPYLWFSCVVLRGGGVGRGEGNATKVLLGVQGMNCTCTSDSRALVVFVDVLVKHRAY